MRTGPGFKLLCTEDDLEMADGLSMLQDTVTISKYSDFKMPKQMSYTTSVEGGRVGGGWSDGEGEGWRGGAAEGWRQAESIVVFNTTGFKQHFYTTSVAPGAWPPSTCFKLSKLYRSGIFGFGFRVRVRHGVVRVRSRHWLRNGCVDFPRRLCDVALLLLLLLLLLTFDFESLPSRMVLSTEGNKGRLGRDWAHREIGDLGLSGFEAFGPHQNQARFTLHQQFWNKLGQLSSEEAGPNPAVHRTAPMPHGLLV